MVETSARIPVAMASSLSASSPFILESFLPPPSKLLSCRDKACFSFPLPRHMQQIVSSASAGALSGSSDSWNISIPPSQNLSESQTLIADKRSTKNKSFRIAGVDQDELVDPWLLADPDSRFADFYGVQIHYKIAQPADDDKASIDGRASDVQAGTRSEPSTSNGLPAILLHGFGASLFSWERVMKPLARLLGSTVVAFDRPAFGLTSRVRIPLVKSRSNGDLIPVHSNPYSIGFSSEATIAFADFLKSDKALLIGHSAGCIVAADAYFKAPERVAAIIMVAPALVAPLLSPGKTRVSKDMKVENKNIEQQGSGWGLQKVWNNLLWAVGMIVALFQKIIAFITGVWRRTVAAVLRSSLATWLLRIIMDKLSLQAVRYAWYDRDRVDDYVIAGYTKPLRCRDWEHALLEYCAALIGDPTADNKASLGERLGEISCPVLVISGDTDIIVPAWNAERLARSLPRAQYRVIKNCGHLPHEEKQEEFLLRIQEFLEWVAQGAIVKMDTKEPVVFVPA